MRLSLMRAVGAARRAALVSTDEKMTSLTFVSVAAAKDLVGYGQSKGYLLFFSPDASLALLTCLLHGADEV